MLSARCLLIIGVTLLLCSAIFFGVRARMIEQAPKTVMEAIEAKIVAASGGWNACYHNRNFGPRASAARRANPDSLITSMAYDLADGPIQVTGETWPRYWSLSLYQQNSDNYYVVNDQQLGETPFNFEIAKRGQVTNTPAATQIISPTEKGIMLIRRFAALPSDMPGILTNQDVMYCGPLNRP